MPDYNVRPYQPPDYSIRPYQPVQQEKEDEDTWLEWIISNGLRTIPAIGGALAFGGPTLGLGSIAGGAGGAALGETLGEMYDVYRGKREAVNPWQVGVQGALGAIPAMGKTPGLGATAEQWTKYALQAPFRGAAEGAILGAGGSVPQAWAEGQDPTWEGAWEGAKGGALFGAGTAGILASPKALKIAKQLKGIGPSADVTTPFTGGKGNYGKFTPDPILGPHDYGPYGIPNKDQLQLPMFGEDGAYGGFGDQPPPPFTPGRMPSGPQDPRIPPPMGPTSPFGPPPGPFSPRPPFDAPIAPPPVEPGQGVLPGINPHPVNPNETVPTDFLTTGPITLPNTPNTQDHIVTIVEASKAQNAELKQKGYVPYAPDPVTRKPRMIKRAQPFAATGGIPPPGQVEGTRMPEVQAARGGQRRVNPPDELVPIKEGETIVYQNPSALQLKNMDDQGYVIAGRNEQTGEVTFQLHDADKLAHHLFGDDGPQAERFDPNEPGLIKRPEQGIDTSKLGPKAQEYLQRYPEYLTHARSPESQIDFVGFLHSLDWERESGDYGFEPRAVADIVGDVTKSDVHVYGPGDATLTPRNPRNVTPRPPELGTGTPTSELITDNTIRHGDNAEFATADGDTFWLDNIQNPDEINAKLQSREWDLIMREGGITPTDVTPGRMPPERGLPPTDRPSELPVIDISPEVPSNPDIAALRTQNLLGNGEPTQGSFDFGPPPSAEQMYRGPSAESNTPELTHPTAQEWDARMRELDANRAPDIKYRDIMSTAGKNPLKKGETWRGRVQQGIDYFERKNRPSAALIEGDEGGYQASVNVTNSIESVTRDYTSKLEGIMAREALQNALDAADLLGDKGVVRIKTSNPSKGVKAAIEIYDNGAGMDDKTIGNKLVEVFSSGKVDDPNATGGKGIGSASFLFGGQHVEIDTVAVDSVNGKKYRIQTKGTPVEFMPPNIVKRTKIEVDPSTPTYTRIKIELKDNQHVTHSRDMVKKIIEHSRNRPSKLIYDFHGMSDIDNTPITHMKVDPDRQITEHNFKSVDTDKVIGDYTFKNSDIKIQIPPFDPTLEVGTVNIHILNNGMYQTTKEFGAFEGYPRGIPKDIVVDIHPVVDEQHPDYPFINTREHLKEPFEKSIIKHIEDNITGPAVERRRNRTQELYDSMTHVKTPGLKRKTVIYDPGQRMTPQEMKAFSSHPIVKNLVTLYDNLVDEILQFANKPAWNDRLESVGIGFTPDVNGYHIPNPATGKSTILFNPFPRMESGMNAADNAWRHTQTGLHEVSHVGTEGGSPLPPFKPEDMLHPDMPQFMADVFNQIQAHGDIHGDTGHGMDFAQRLGEVYAAFGPERTRKYADAFHEIFTGGKSGTEYSPEFQELLQRYTESRGRDATTEDLLTRTGVKQADTRPYAEENVPSPSQEPGDGTPPVVPPKKKKTGEGNWQKLYNLSRGLTTPLDLSAVFRQGSGLMHTKAYWQSWDDMVKAGMSEQAYKTINDDIRSREMFQRRQNRRTAKIMPSFAEQAGLAIQDLPGGSRGREEATPSDWAESGGFLGKNNPAQRAYKGTIGRGVRASNRAYTAFLNKVRADTFEKLINDAEALYRSNPTKEINPRENMKFAREIAEFVNTASGRGPLKLALPKFQLHDPTTGGISPRIKMTEVSAEKFAHGTLGLTNILFSPRLIASRMRMLNPGTYVMASPFVRKQYMKAALSSASLWMGIAGTAAAAGAVVSTDMDSADYGKVRIGDNVRLDPGQGFQQFMVAFHRMLSGRYVSSASSREFTLGEGYKADTRGDVARRFAANKLHPVMKFGYDLLHASERVPVPLMDRTMQMYVPLIVQDLWEISKEDPKLLPLSIFAGLGLGTQIYGKDDLEGSKFINPQSDFLFKGGPISQIFEDR